jgi:hypothetical protein
VLSPSGEPPHVVKQVAPVTRVVLPEKISDEVIADTFACR